ncbi:MAG: hypothetical protein ABSE43_07125 [Steroidobacteraceae bacterium]|jgi:hypothetical protein
MEQALTPSASLGDAPITFSGKSATSWPAIAAGAFVAIGTSLVLLALGAGLGFASTSPRPDRGVSASTLVISAAIWLIVTQWLSAAMGGYIAGRLRSRWVGTHTHEVFFRDTAHGLITWAVATVLVAGFVGSTAHMLINGVTRAASEVATAGAQTVSTGALGAYGTDKLFRPSNIAPGNGGASGENDARTEAQHIIANSLTDGHVSDADRTYLVQLVAARAGISQADAQQRVDQWLASSLDAEAQLKAAAEATRKAASETAIYTALSLLIGAFIASVAAALGGRLRDLHA